MLFVQGLRSFLLTFALVKRVCLLFLLTVSLGIKAQPDTVSVDTTGTQRSGVMQPVHWILDYLSNTNKPKNKAFDGSLVFGPSYNNTASLGLGGAYSGIYSWDPSDTLLTKSNVSLFFNASIKGYFQIGLRGNNYMPQDRQRWNYKLTAQLIPTDFWGIGYESADLDANKGSYHELKLRFNPDYLFRVARNLYVGPEIDLNYSRNYHFDSDTTLARIEGQDKNIFSVGAGFIFQYDSRDFILNPYRGNFIRLEQLFYPKYLNTYHFYRTEMTYDAYRKVWKRCILALDLHSQLNYGGDVPWTMLALVGDDSSRMRGYYEGRYRDRNIIEGQLELRQSLPYRLGFVVFVGCANSFHDFDSFKWRQTLPNYGVGLRWEFKSRINFRVDMGMTSKHKPGFCVNMNEAF